MKHIVFNSFTFRILSSGLSISYNQLKIKQNEQTNGRMFAAHALANEENESRIQFGRWAASNAPLKA